MIEARLTMQPDAPSQHHARRLQDQKGAGEIDA